MKKIAVILSIFIVAIINSCKRSDKDEVYKKKIMQTMIYAREPKDSSNYKHLKYNLYLNTHGQLYERKLIFANNMICNCEFEVDYDPNYLDYTDIEVIKKSLNAVIDIHSFTEIDSSQFSKDKNNVYFFYANSDGGNRVIVNKADPATFRRLCEYRWGIDKNHVFCQANVLEGINLKKMKILFSTVTANQFLNYVKDDKVVYYEDEIVEGADAKTFKMASDKEWEAEDKNRKYSAGHPVK